MLFEFNLAQLSRPQRNNLIELLGVIESENDQEIEVRVIEFPKRFSVKLDDDIEMLLGWDPETDGYAGLTTPESAANGVLKRVLDRVAAFREKPNPVEPEPELQDDLGIGGPEPIPEPELDLSPVFERAEALALVLVNLSKPLNTEQRMETWMRFCLVLAKELWK